MDASTIPYADQENMPFMNVVDVQLGEGIRERLKTQRDNGRFCDVVFHVHSIEFPAHRCILAACSPYFDSVLDLNRSGKEHLTISADWKVFSELMDFIYTGKINIHDGNVAELLRLSGYFLMSRLKDYCGEFLERSLSVKNCLGIKELSEKCGLLNMAVNSTAFIQEHMNELINELELLDLSKKKLEAFLNNKAFIISDETRLIMVSRWVMRNCSQREAEFKKLLNLPSLQRIEHMRIFEIMETEALFHTSAACLYDILHELYSCGIHLGPLEITYSNLCQKFAEPQSLFKTCNVLDMAVSSTLGVMGPLIPKTPDAPPVQSLPKAEPNQSAEHGGEDHGSLGDLDGNTTSDNGNTTSENVNTGGLIEPIDVESKDSGSKILDHLSYTRISDTDIVKEHLVETNSGGGTQLVPRFDDDDKSEVPPTPMDEGSEVSKPKSEDASGVQPKEEPERELESVDRPVEELAEVSLEECYEAETDDNDGDADFGAEDDEVKSEGRDPGLEVATEPTQAAGMTESSRRKRKGRPPQKAPSRVPKQVIEFFSDEEVPDTDRKMGKKGTKAARRRTRVRVSSTQERKKSVILKISTKRNKGAKRQIPPKKPRVKVSEILSCHECNYTTRRLQCIEAHQRNAHQGVSQSCNKCDFTSKWNKEFFKHMKTHYQGPPYCCDVEECKYVSDKFQLLLHHQKRHSDDRPFECPDCHMKFRTRNNLSSHVRCHSGEKPFQCPDCQRCFATKSTLSQHSVTHSNHRPYLCDTCGFSTKYQSHLIAHKRIHTGDVYRCVHPGCTYFTPKRSQLNAHMRIHMSIRSHICSQCGRGFVERSHLVRHEKLHSNEKGFKCTECDYASYRRDKLKLHMEKHHTPGGASLGSSPHRPRKQRVRSIKPEVSVPVPGTDIHMPVLPAPYNYQAQNQYTSHIVSVPMETKPMCSSDVLYTSPQIDPMIREQYAQNYRAPTPNTGTSQEMSTVSPNGARAPVNAHQNRVAGYIVQPMAEQNPNYTPQGDIGGLGAFMALF